MKMMNQETHCIEKRSKPKNESGGAETDALIKRLEPLTQFMRQTNIEVVYAFKNAAGNEVVLKHEVPESQVTHTYDSLVALAAKILESESDE